MRRRIFSLICSSSKAANRLKPYVLAPRVLSRQEWIEQYSGDKGPGEDHSGDG
jgi:hypothetical protein